MKKFILPLLLLLAVGMLAAVESDPSAVVGYFKKSVGDGEYKTLVLPFSYASLAINDVMGAQFLDNDVIQDINSGLGSTYYSGFGFDGDLLEMAYGVGYYVNRAVGNGAGDYYVFGTVDPQAFTIDIAGDGSFTAFGLNEAAEVPLYIDAHPFGTNPSDGDVIQEIDTGASSTFYDGYGWDGDLQVLTPTNAYYYNAFAGTTGFTWTYTPSRGTSAQTSSTASKLKKVK